MNRQDAKDAKGLVHEVYLSAEALAKAGPPAVSDQDAQVIAGLLRILARRSLAVGIGCRTDACKYPKDEPGPGATCPHLDECLADLELVRSAAREGT